MFTLKLRYHQGATCFTSRACFCFVINCTHFTHHVGVENDLVEFRPNELASYSKVVLLY